MHSKKPVIIVNTIALVFQVLATAFMWLLYSDQTAVHELMAQAQAFGNVTVFPMTHVYTNMTLLFFLIVMEIIICNANGRALRVAGIVLCAVYAFVCLFAGFMPAAESAIVAKKGAVYVAALSSLNTGISLIVSPFKTIAATGFVFVCGMDVYAGRT